MPLVLGLEEGQGVYIGNEFFEIGQVTENSYEAFGPNEGDDYVVSEDDMVSVRERIFLSMSPQQTHGVARVMIKAPVHVPISRADSEDSEPRRLVGDYMVGRFKEDYMPDTKGDEVRKYLEEACEKATVSEDFPGWREHGDYLLRIRAGRLIAFDHVE